MDNKGLFMMSLLHTDPLEGGMKKKKKKNLREKIYQEVGITLPCAGLRKMKHALWKRLLAT